MKLVFVSLAWLAGGLVLMVLVTELLVRNICRKRGHAWRLEVRELPDGTESIEHRCVRCDTWATAT